MIRQALSETVLKVEPSTLAKKRYKNYQLKENQWTVIEVLQRYLVPAEKIVLDEKHSIVISRVQKQKLRY